MIGRKYGRLTVVEQTEAPEGKSTREAWYACSCECGGSIAARGSCLRSGETKSCGCLRSEVTRMRNVEYAVKFHDLTGKRFGRLVAEKRLDYRKYGQQVWLCRCDCGNYCDAAAGSLKSGGVKSCGCLPTREPYDLTGRKFGRLTVLKIVPERKAYRSVVWECRCDCGNRVMVQAGNLLCGSTASCGCIRREELTGQRFGKLTVLRIGSRSGKGRGSFWVCRCDCGNECEVHAFKLKSGHTRSCGCLHGETIRDLTGERFGLLTVIEDSGERRTGRGGIIWRCRCDCGQEKLIRQDALVSGRTVSCGCVKSKGNKKVAEILKQHNIQCIPEYTPDDICGRYRFDFAVLDMGQVSYCIEYDGQLHFDYTGSGWDTEERFERTRKSDAVKNKYCAEHGLPLIRIPYTAYNGLTVDDLVPERTKYLYTAPNR